MKRDLIEGVFDVETNYSSVSKTYGVHNICPEVRPYTSVCLSNLVGVLTKGIHQSRAIVRISVSTNGFQCSVRKVASAASSVFRAAGACFRYVDALEEIVALMICRIMTIVIGLNMLSIKGTKKGKPFS